MVTEVLYNLEGIPNVKPGTGPIKIGTFFRGQRFTKQAYYRDEIVSLLQKAIRRGLKREALFAAKELYSMGGPFLSNLINRLKVIISEDISIGNYYLPVYARKLLENAKKNSFNILKLVCIMCDSVKCRWCDELVHLCMEEPIGYKKIGKFTIKKVKKKDYIYRYGLVGDNKKYTSLMNRFVKELDGKRDIKMCCAIMQRIFDLKKLNLKGRSTSKGGKSKDPVYGIWEMFLKRANQSKKRVINALFKFFDEKNNGRTERLFLIHALLVFLDVKEINVMDGLVEERFNVKKKKKIYPMAKVVGGWVNFWVNPGKIGIPVDHWALDKHTFRGKALGRGVKWFWEKGALIENGIKSPYFEDAKKLAVLRERNDMKGRKRMRLHLVDLRKKKESLEKKKIRKKKRGKDDNYEDLEKEYRKIKRIKC
jgi:hypothetical protein